MYSSVRDATLDENLQILCDHINQHYTHKQHFLSQAHAQNPSGHRYTYHCKYNHTTHDARDVGCLELTKICRKQLSVMISNFLRINGYHPHMAYAVTWWHS